MVAVLVVLGIAVFHGPSVVGDVAGAAVLLVIW